MGRISRRIFGLSMDEVRFDVRGFRGGDEPGIREHVETVGESFLAGFHGALEHDDLAELEQTLEAVETYYRGFAYEGAAMSLYLLDRLLPWRKRFETFLEGRGDDHVYMAHVGAGWALARLPFGFRSGLDRLEPLMRWLAVDGYGFHQGFFHWPEAVEGQAVPAKIRAYGPKTNGRSYGERAFDQGLGRSLWFVDGADVERIPRTIAAFDEIRHADMWAGIGLAATYAGGVSEDRLESLRQSAERAGFLPELAQGSVFAAEARRRAGNLTSNCETATRLFCDMGADDAATLSDETGVDLPPDGEIPVYEVWRGRIQEHFRAAGSGASETPVAVAAGAAE